MATKTKLTDVQKLGLKAAGTRAGLTALLKDAYRQLDERKVEIAKLQQDLEDARATIENQDREYASCQLELKVLDAEIAFWMEDSDYYRGRLLDHARDRARRAAENRQEQARREVYSNWEKDSELHETVREDFAARRESGT